ncbi:conserved hypothetical protein [Mycobacterium tuberculosis GM 1503]|nr:conserved hypothetical protein [Mycobacterium tuberculosis GM 1503]
MHFIRTQSQSSLLLILHLNKLEASYKLSMVVGRARHATEDYNQPRYIQDSIDAPNYDSASPTHCSQTPRWPVTFIARHRDGVSSGTASSPGDGSLEEECGLAVLIEKPGCGSRSGTTTATASGTSNGVTGPDEYTAVVRDNVFTNLMAAHNLHTAADACLRHPEAAEAMGVTTEEMAAWRDAADAANIPYDEELGVHQQCEGFTTLAEWDFEANTTYPLLLHEAYVRLYPAQVIKQADLVLAMQWQSHAFTPEQKARNVDYYERRMVRDSSLSACTQAVMCAEVGHLELAHDYAYEAALIDLRDLHRNTRDGLHMASLAGAWTALVVGFGGLRDDEGILSIDPQLPDGISRLRFRLRWRGFRLIVDANHTDVTFILGDGPGTQLTMRHAGQDLTLHTDTPSTIAVRTRKPLLPPPPQPPGREPVHRRALAR